MTSQNGRHRLAGAWSAARSPQRSSSASVQPTASAAPGDAGTTDTEAPAPEMTGDQALAIIQQRIRPGRRRRPDLQLRSRGAGAAQARIQAVEGEQGRHRGGVGQAAEPGAADRGVEGRPSPTSAQIQAQAAGTAGARRRPGRLRNRRGAQCPFDRAASILGGPGRLTQAPCSTKNCCGILVCPEDRGAAAADRRRRVALQPAVAPCVPDRGRHPGAACRRGGHRDR